MNGPLVSVLMACRNNVPFVEEAVESVLAQDYGQVELVAIDDASTDDTATRLAALARRHPGRIRFLRNTGQRGIAAVRSQALSEARGQLIALLDGDDLWLPHKLTRQVALLERHPDACLVHGGYEAFSNATGEEVSWDSYDGPRDGFILRSLFCAGCFVMSGTVVLRREAMRARAIGFRDTGMLSYDDYWLYLVLSLDRPVVYEPTVGFRYRRHGGNLTEQLFAKNVHLARIRLLEQFVSAYPEAGGKLGPARRRGLAGHWLQAAAFELAAGRSRSSLRCVARAAGLSPGVTLRGVAGSARARLGSTGGTLRR